MTNVNEEALKVLKLAAAHQLPMLKTPPSWNVDFVTTKYVSKTQRISTSIWPWFIIVTSFWMCLVTHLILADIVGSLQQLMTQTKKWYSIMDARKDFQSNTMSKNVRIWQEAQNTVRFSLPTNCDHFKFLSWIHDIPLLDNGGPRKILVSKSRNATFLGFYNNL